MIKPLLVPLTTRLIKAIRFGVFLSTGLLLRLIGYRVCNGLFFGCLLRPAPGEVFFRRVVGSVLLVYTMPSTFGAGRPAFSARLQNLTQSHGCARPLKRAIMGLQRPGHPLPSTPKAGYFLYTVTQDLHNQKKRHCASTV